ncbi:hypothetical protein ANN_03709 [Periplaneta americana]|uniref:Uncharacterized protein n=1 Tax=Periplaneta americana TaxID=6978 RepID=A0ABQ8U2W9_PERAM|nr:hypothetical protein ANN_03709 [Periplaneta americana]
MAGLCEGGNEPPSSLKASAAERTGAAERTDERIAYLLCPIQFISTRHFNIKPHFNKAHIKTYGMHKLSDRARVGITLVIRMRARDLWEHYPHQTPRKYRHVTGRSECYALLLHHSAWTAQRTQLHDDGKKQWLCSKENIIEMIAVQILDLKYRHPIEFK